MTQGRSPAAINPGLEDAPPLGAKRPLRSEATLRCEAATSMRSDPSTRSGSTNRSDPSMRRGSTNRSGPFNTERFYDAEFRAVLLMNWCGYVGGRALARSRAARSSVVSVSSHAA